MLKEFERFPLHLVRVYEGKSCDTYMNLNNDADKQVYGAYWVIKIRWYFKDF